MPKDLKKIKVFCIPYAGGSSMVYSKWEKYLSDSIEIIPIELAGRGRRFKDEFNTCLDEIVADIYNNIKDDIATTEYALFGHSMGGLLVYEVCRMIISLKQRQPIHIFISASKPPHARREDKAIKYMSDKEIIEELFELDSSNRRLYEDKQRWAKFIPVWKSDCNIVDQYEFQYPIFDLKINMSILGGKSDPFIHFSDLEEWERYTSCKCNIQEFDGGHFFVVKNCRKAVEFINSTLSQYIIEV